MSKEVNNKWELCSFQKKIKYDFSGKSKMHRKQTISNLRLRDVQNHAQKFQWTMNTEHAMHNATWRKLFEGL